MSFTNQEIREAVEERAEEIIDQFISKRCFIKNKGYVTVREFKSQLSIFTSEWISQKVLSKVMKQAGFTKRLVYYRGKQQQAFFGLVLGIRPLEC